MSLVNANIGFFDSNDLTAVSGVTILATNPYTPAQRNVKVGDVARSDKSNVNAAFYNNRDITLRVGITRASRDLVEASFDSLMTLLQGLEKTLIVKQAGATRQYTATYSDCLFRTQGGSYLEFDLVFVTSDHFGYDVSPIQLLAFTGFTSNYRSDQLTFGGSAPFQVPTITLTFTSITSTGTKAVTIANGANGQSVVISRTWVTGDVLQINSGTKTVKVNGSEVAFTGAIPEFSQGIGYWVYSDTFTARTFNGLLQYNKRYV
jgi:uncharacterized Zn-binding protein involved in type VI secretion